MHYDTRCSGVPGTAPYSTTQRSTAQRSTAQHSTAQHSTAQHSTAHQSTAKAKHSITQHNTTQHNAAQHSTAQHSTAQRSTTKHNTVQHSTAQHIKPHHNTPHHNTPQHRQYNHISTVSTTVLSPPPNPLPPPLTHQGQQVGGHDGCFRELPPFAPLLPTRGKGQRFLVHGSHRRVAHYCPVQGGQHFQLEPTTDSSKLSTGFVSFRCVFCCCCLSLSFVVVCSCLRSWVCFFSSFAHGDAIHRLENKMLSHTHPHIRHVHGARTNPLPPPLLSPSSLLHDLLPLLHSNVSQQLFQFLEKASPNYTTMPFAV